MRRRLGLYIAAIYAVATAAVAAVAALDASVDRLWLGAVVAALVAAQHLVEMRVLRGGGEAESYSHEETYVVVLALLASPLVAIGAVAVGFAVGNAIVRRDPVKALFNVGAMALSTAAAMLAFAALAPADTTSIRAAVAAALGLAVFALTNRLLLAGVFELVGAARFREELRDEVPARLVVLAADGGLGLLAAFAAATSLWTLPVALAALLAIHHALAGHAAARAERQKLADIVRSSSDGIVALGANDRIVAWNPAATALTGYDASEMLGRPLTEVTETLEAEEEAVAEHGAAGTALLLVRTKEGDRRWLDVRRAPTPDGGSTLVMRDETRRRAAEATRVREQTERLRSDLVAAVSHELRTPLASILGFAQTMLAQETPPAKRIQYLEIIREQGERLRELIDDLLDLRSIGGRASSTEVFDLRDLVAEQVTELASQSQIHELRLALPDRPSPVRGDRSRLRQVFSNLIANAIKYSPAGGPIDVSMSRTETHVQVEVADPGLGIPSDQQARVFEPFFRADNVESAGIRGTGLGLALAREIVRAHDGDIRIASSGRDGSTFSVELPVADGRS